MSRVVLKNLSPYEYEHDQDRKALYSLKQTPGLPKLLELINRYSVDKITKINHTGSYLKLGENQVPSVYHIFLEACEILDVRRIPMLYLRQGYLVDAYATCSSEPIITIYSAAIDKLTDIELMFLIGRELGHVKSEHILYKDVADKLGYLGILLGQMTLGVGTILSSGLEIALKFWNRMSELTADRAGLLACQDYEAAIQMITKQAGTANLKIDDRSVNIDAFMKQIEEFDDYDFDAFDKVAKMLFYNDTHPWTVSRASEIQSWHDSPLYHAVLRRDRSKFRIISEKELICNKCKSVLSINSKFCGVCGSKLRT